jgi:uncharacterized protein YjbI with pentapeptide repeats
MIRHTRHLRLRILAGCAPVMLLAMPVAGVAQQESAPEANRVEGGLLSDDFASDSGAIIVIGKRPGEGNLFEAVETPKTSCLASAPPLGAKAPGFTIDASRFKKAKQLEAFRRKTRQGTIFVSGGTFVGADLRKLKLYDMCFFGTDFSQSDWTGVAAPGLGFVNVDLTGAQMKDTHLPDVLLRDTRLELVNAAGARWMQGRLDGGWEGSLRGLDLTNADLTDFRFACGSAAKDGCPVARGEMLMAGANLRRASLATFHAGDLLLTAARIDQTELALDHLVLLRDARLVGPVVLRSAGRAVMLFPQEVARLAEVSAASDPVPAACAQTASDNAGLASMCALPGSEPRDLLRSVAQLEASARAQPDFVGRQKAWHERRDGCMALPDPDEQPACLMEAYRTRLGALRTALGTPQWVSQPGYRLFLSREAAFPTDRDEPGLYAKILPVLLDSAAAAVILRTDGKGDIAAKGVARSACGFDVSGLVYDAASGQLGMPAKAPAARAPARERRPARRAPAATTPAVALVAVGTNGAAVLDEGLARVSDKCADANPFPQLDEITLDNELLEEIWDRF